MSKRGAVDSLRGIDIHTIEVIVVISIIQTIPCIQSSSVNSLFWTGICGSCRLLLTP